MMTTTDFREDNGVVEISINYILPPSSKTYPKFSGIAIAPANAFICKGKLASMKAGTKFDSGIASMLCERNTKVTSINTPEGRVMLTPPASISVQTEAGSVTRHVAPVFKEKPPIVRQLGEVVASMLGEATFISVNGNGWVLADGRSVPGTQYAMQVGPAVPDLRGVFLRGKNYGRDVASGNADGDLAIGTFQKFELIKHTHGTTIMVGDNNVDGVDSAARNSGEHHNQSKFTEPFGGNEVRPNNVTVNYFIRIN